MPVLQGAYNVPHFDAKAEADQFFDRLSTEDRSQLARIISLLRRP